MSVYDLDRWERSLSTVDGAAASLTLHLHPSHCRFEHQNGVFLYDSPIRSLLCSIRDARLPNTLLDLLDATDVRYFDGCLVVEVHDHRNDDPAAAVDSGSNAHGGGGGGGGTIAATGDGITVQDGSLAVSHLGKRANDGTLLKHAGQAASSSGNSGANAVNGDTPTSTSNNNTMTTTSSAANQFRFNFVTSFKRFEEARRDLRRKIEQHKAREAAAAAAAAATTSSSSTATLPAAAAAAADAIRLDASGMSSALHSAVAAAVAAAPEQAVQGAGESAKNKKQPTTQYSSTPVYRIVLGPDTETIWTDLLIMREAKKKKWTEREMVEMEAKILVSFVASD